MKIQRKIDPRELGANIRKRRLAVKMTQQQVAEAADLSAVTLSKIETGTHIPVLGNLVALAEALATTPNDLLGWGAQVEVDPNTAMAAAIATLPEDWRQIVMSIVTRAGDQEKQ